MNLHPIRRAFERGLELGAARTRAEDIAYLRAQAAANDQGGPSDRIRRGTLNHAADRLRDGLPPGRPKAGESA